MNRNNSQRASEKRTNFKMGHLPELSFVCLRDNISLFFSLCFFFSLCDEHFASLSFASGPRRSDTEDDLSARSGGGGRGRAWLPTRAIQSMHRVVTPLLCRARRRRRRLSRQTPRPPPRQRQHHRTWILPLPAMLRRLQTLQMHLRAPMRFRIRTNPRNRRKQRMRHKKARRKKKRRRSRRSHRNRHRSCRNRYKQQSRRIPNGQRNILKNTHARRKKKARAQRRPRSPRSRSTRARMRCRSCRR